MDRRKFLSATAVFVFFSGCTGDGEENPNTATEKPPSEGVTPECWDTKPAMCEGTKLADVSVASTFPGDVVLTTNCRNEEFSIQSGKSVEIIRKEDGETCRISLSVDGEQVFDEVIREYETVSLTVDSNGEVGEERVVI